MLNPENKNETKLVLDVLNTNYEDIENTSLGNKEQGIKSGFYNFDALTQGLNRGDLIVLGGRPAMGKTSISLNIALNIAEKNSVKNTVFKNLLKFIKKGLSVICQNKVKNLQLKQHR